MNFRLKELGFIAEATRQRVWNIITQTKWPQPKNKNFSMVYTVQKSQDQPLRQYVFACTLLKKSHARIDAISVNVYTNGRFEPDWVYNLETLSISCFSKGTMQFEDENIGALNFLLSGFYIDSKFLSMTNAML